MFELGWSLIYHFHLKKEISSRPDDLICMYHHDIGTDAISIQILKVSKVERPTFWAELSFILDTAFCFMTNKRWHHLNFFVAET